MGGICNSVKNKIIIVETQEVKNFVNGIQRVIPISLSRLIHKKAEIFIALLNINSNI